MTGQKGTRPERIGDLLSAFLKQSGLDERLDEAGVVPDWAERVGPAIAAVTTPLRVSRGTLLVSVRSSAWLMELQMMERQIRAALNEHRERGRVQRIRFVMADGGPPPSSRDRKR